MANKLAKRSGAKTQAPRVSTVKEYSVLTSFQFLEHRDNGKTSHVRDGAINKLEPMNKAKKNRKKANLNKL